MHAFLLWQDYMQPIKFKLDTDCHSRLWAPYRKLIESADRRFMVWVSSIRAVMPNAYTKFSVKNWGLKTVDSDSKVATLSTIRRRPVGNLSRRCRDTEGMHISSAWAWKANLLVESGPCTKPKNRHCICADSSKNRNPNRIRSLNKTLKIVIVYVLNHLET